jgi:hypothetical protein
MSNRVSAVLRGGFLLVGLFAASLPTVTAVAQRRNGEDRKKREKRFDKEASKRRLKAIRSALVSQARKGTSSSIGKALRTYNSVERSGEFSDTSLHAIHQSLVKELRASDGETVARVAKSVLRKSTSTSFPSQVVVLKAIARSKGKIAEATLVDLFLGAAKHKDRRISTWAVRLFADTRSASAIDVLIDLLAAEENSGRYFGDLASVIQGELYRVLGSIAMGDSYSIKKSWEKSGKKIPKRPNYSVSAGAASRGKTVFFGDRLSTRAVFCIDVSGSMKGKVKMGKKGPAASKVDIVKEELAKAVGGLTPENRFNIIAYDGKCSPWRDRGKLLKGTRATVKAGQAYARGLKIGSGTNIHDAMVAGLGVSGVETIYLLSDGAPSVGGNADQIRKRVGALNYLRGVRVVTYGFAGSDAKLMRDLASSHWGWYRALNE